MRWPRSAVVLTLLCLVVSGCGSALTPQQRAEVLGAPGQAGPGGGDLAPGDPAAPGAGGGPDDPAGDDDPAGPGGGTGPSAGPPVQCSGTGGATDTGVTDDTITIANVSDVSGPVQGLFESSQLAVKAYVAYVNSTGGVCGRRLQLLLLDSRTDSRGDQEGTQRACTEAFALVGSISAYDQGGATAAANCGIPDLRAVSTTAQRQRVANSFGVNSNSLSYQPAAVPDYFRGKYPDAVKNAAFIYLNAEVSKQNKDSTVRAYTQRGFTFTYEQAIDVADFNYAPYVVQLRDRGIRYVQWLGSNQHAVRLLQAMKQQGYKPDVFVMDSVAYDANFVRQAGDAAEGVTVFTNVALLEEGGNAELALYRSWLARVAPGKTPDYFGFYAWGAAKLFVELAAKVGPNLTREAFLAQVRTVREYTANGLFAAQNVAGKQTGRCWVFIRLQGGRWVREAPSSGYRCGDVISTGVG